MKKNNAAEAIPFQRNVVLDTNVFKKSNFNFNAYPLKQLKERFEGDRATVFITEIADHEVRARMKRELEDAQKHFGAFRKAARILFSAPGGALHNHDNKLPLEKLVNNMNAAFDQFLTKLDVKEIDCTKVSLGPVLQSFFNVEAPFAHADDKRREFPDAISVAAIAAYFEDSGACVISEDQLFQKACKHHEHLDVFPTLEKFLAAELADHEDVSWIVAAIRENSQEIKQAITEAFEETYFYLDDQEGDVERVKITDLDMEKPILVGAAQYEGTLSVSCQFSYTAEISYEDPNMTVYSEGERFSFGTVDETISRDHSEVFTVAFQINRIEKEISDFTCPAQASWGITAVDYED